MRSSPNSSPRSESSRTSGGGGGARGVLFLLGFVIVLLQLLILFQMSQHTTVIDVRASSLNEQSRMSMSITSNELKQKKPKIISSDAHQAPQTRIDAASSTKADGTFSGVPIYYHTVSDDNIHSTVSCVGENYQPNAYMYRSCHFTHFCFDTEKKDFVLFQSPQEQEWSRHALRNVDIGTSSTMTNMTVALGGLNPKWKEQTFTRLEWFPEILPSSALVKEGYYQLPENLVWVPFHSFAGFNAGHIICKYGTCVYRSSIVVVACCCAPMHVMIVAISKSSASFDRSSLLRGRLFTNLYTARNVWTTRRKWITTISDSLCTQE